MKSSCSKKPSTLVIGLALFSMFFGSGNLIFPLFIGQMAQSHWLFGALGFLLTAALLPFTGIIAMLIYKGDYTRFFNRIGNKMGLILTAVLLTVWIPIGSFPRCINLAYASLLQFIELPPLWLFSLIYCVLLYFVSFKKSRILDLLGYILTPLLLICLFIIIIKGVDKSNIIKISNFSEIGIFFRGLSEGYNTMDLIASFFFSATIISILKNSKNDEKSALKQTFKACIIAISILSTVYLGLIYLAANNSAILEGIPKDQLLAYISKVLLNPGLSLIAVSAIILACFTTSIALVVVYTNFLRKHLFNNSNSSRGAITLTLLGTFTMSIFGLEGITRVSSPILSICYPLLILLILFNVSYMIYQKRKALTLTPIKDNNCKDNNCKRE